MSLKPPTEGTASTATFESRIASVESRSVLVAASATSGTTVQAAITALGVAGGEIVLLPGDHTWDTTPTIPPAITGRLRIRTAQGAKIVHTTGARRCFDWGKVADYDTFQNVELGPLLVDAASFGGQHHVVIGPWQGGSWQRKINLDNVHVHDVEIINAVVGTDSATDFRIGVHIGMAASTASDSLCTATNCSVRRVKSTGCLQLVAIHGVPVGAETTAKVYHDDIVVEDIEHRLPTTPTAFNAGAHVMAGTKGTGGKITIRRVYGRNSPDVGIESGAWQSSTVDDCDIEDAYDFPYYHVNYNTVASPEAQLLTFTKAVSRRNLLNRTGTNNTGFKIGDSANASATVRASSVHFGAGCLHQRLSTSAGVEQQFEAVDVYGCRRVTGEVHAVMELPSYSTGVAVSPSAFRIRSDSTSNRTDVRLKLACRVTGTVSGSGAGNMNWRTLLLREGLLSGFDVEVTSDVNFSGAGNSTVIHADIGATSGSATISGRLKVDIPTSGGGGNTPIGIQFESGVINTITSNEEIVVHDCNFAGLASTSTDVNFTGATTMASRTRFVNNKWRTAHQSRRAVSANTNINSLYDLVATTDTTAARTHTLPGVTAIPVGKVITFVDESNGAGTNNITIQRGGSDTFTDAATSKAITTNGGKLAVYSNGTNWVLA